MWAASLVQAAATAAADQQTNDHVLFIGGLFGLAGVTITAVFGYLGHRQAKENSKEVKEINNAVNHKGPDQLRLFDMVAETHERAIANGEELAQFRLSIDHRLDRFDRQNAAAHRGFEDHIGRVESKVDDTAARFQEHVDWEVNVKWPSLENTVIPPTNPEPPQEATS